MRTTKEVLYFCNEFTFYDQYNIERVAVVNHVRGCVNSVLSKRDFIRKNLNFRALGVFDDISLMVKDGNVENLIQEANNLRFCFRQLLCLENLYKGEVAKEDEKVITLNEKDIISCDQVKSFRDKKCFYFANGI